MSKEISAVTESLVEAVSTSYSHMGKTSGSSEETAPAVSVKFSFDEDFQRAVAVLALRDYPFLRRVAHLLKPEYFESASNQTIVAMALHFYKKWNAIIPKSTLRNVLEDVIKNRIVEKSQAVEIITAMSKMYKEELPSAEYVASKVSAFASEQAITGAIMRLAEMLSKKGVSEKAKMEAIMREALLVGQEQDGEAVSYWEKVEERTQERLDKIAGIRPPEGITTGNLEFDALLLHNGWGRRELSSIMGGAKTGKTTALVNFAKGASMAGFNVLYATLEVSERILSERLDASVSDIEIKNLGMNVLEVQRRIKATRHGELRVAEFPSGTLTPNKLREVIDKNQSAIKGKFDLIVVDYADIMAPNIRTNDTIENSKSVYVDLRAIAFDYNAAVLTATQTNREGFKSTVAKAEHVAEDFNKVRTVDLMISINITEEERARGEARLFFAASRNQESGFTVHVKQNIAKMRFLEKVLRIE